jgi:large subunit ribosomal protein L17
MRHRVAGKSLGRPTDQRIAIIKSLVAGVLEHGYVTTTEARAKEARRVIEKVITLGREDCLVNRQRVRKWIPMGKRITTRAKFFNVTGQEPEYKKHLKGADMAPFGERLITKLFAEIGPQFKDRPGGYLRLTKLGGESHSNSKGVTTIRPARRGDAASMVKIELVAEPFQPKAD